MVHGSPSVIFQGGFSVNYLTVSHLPELVNKLKKTNQMYDVCMTPIAPNSFIGPLTRVSVAESFSSTDPHGNSLLSLSG